MPPPFRIGASYKVRGLTLDLLQCQGFTDEERSAALNALAFADDDHDAFIDVLGYVSPDRKEAIWNVYMSACAAQGDYEEDYEEDYEDRDGTDTL